MIDSARLIERIRKYCVRQADTGHSGDMSLLLELAWRSESAVHTDCHFQQWPAIDPDKVPTQLAGLFANPMAGNSNILRFDAGQLLPRFEAAKCIEMEAAHFKAPSYRNMPLRPAAGRFYPRRFIAGVAGIDRHDITPMRVTAVDAVLGIDLNHPLAGRELALKSTVVDVAAPGAPQAAGQRNDFGSGVTANGPGMQARWKSRPTDFWSDDPFTRDDAAADSEFYRQSRLVIARFAATEG